LKIEEKRKKNEERRMKDNRELYLKAVSMIGKEQMVMKLHSFLLRSIRKARTDQGLPSGDEINSKIELIIAHLNKLTGLNYRSSTKATRNLIRFWLIQGFTVEDFKKVHEIKCKQWLNNENSVYLRPLTLYNGSKFEGYLQQWYINKSREEHRERKKKITHPGHLLQERETKKANKESAEKIHGIMENLRKKLRK